MLRTLQPQRLWAEERGDVPKAGPSQRSLSDCDDRETPSPPSLADAAGNCLQAAQGRAEPRYDHQFELPVTSPCLLTSLSVHPEVHSLLPILPLLPLHNAEVETRT